MPVLQGAAARAVPGAQERGRADPGPRGGGARAAGPRACPPSARLAARCDPGRSSCPSCPRSSSWLQAPWQAGLTCWGPVCRRRSRRLQSSSRGGRALPQLRRERRPYPVRREHPQGHSAAWRAGHDSVAVPATLLLAWSDRTQLLQHRFTVHIGCSSRQAMAAVRPLGCRPPTQSLQHIRASAMRNTLGRSCTGQHGHRMPVPHTPPRVPSTACLRLDPLQAPGLPPDWTQHIPPELLQRCNQLGYLELKDALVRASLSCASRAGLRGCPYPPAQGVLACMMFSSVSSGGWRGCRRRDVQRTQIWRC